MSTIEDIKADLAKLTDTVNAFQVAGPTGVPVAEVAKVEGEVAALDQELKSDEGQTA